MSVSGLEEMKETLVQIEENAGMKQMWEQFRKKNYFVGDLEWEDVLSDVMQVISKCIINRNIC